MSRHVLKLSEFPRRAYPDSFPKCLKMSRSTLDSDIQYLPGVGPKRAALLRSELGVGTFGDLIRLYPFRYTDRSTIVLIASIRPDMAYVQIRAKVIRSESIVGKRLSVIVADSSGEMELVFFKGLKWTSEKLAPGKEFIFFGKPTGFNGRINIVHPEIDPIHTAEGNAKTVEIQGNPASAMSGTGVAGEGAGTVTGAGATAAAGTGPGTGIATGTMTGVYSSTERLRNGGITGKVMNRLEEAALNAVLPEIYESLPAYIIKEKGLVPIRYALRNIHFPENMTALEKAKYRLKFEELFYLQLSLLKQKYVRSRNENGIPMPKVGEAFNLCYKALPFDLTDAQKRVIREIREDLRSGHQMNRLLQGDVGSGKTMVAVLTALIAIGNGYQACIMAPTEVLAQQHFRNISKYLEPAGVRAALLTGSSKAAERREIHTGLEDGSIGLIVGTHALIEDDVLFRNLGLAIIDEQHRFGVEQRSKLWKKSAGGIPPHILVMTATPIPRTLAMTLYGDLDVSVIDELPPGRKPVLTMHAKESKRNALFRFMKDQIALGRQVFVVYPLIFESETLDYKNLEQGFDQIATAFPLPKYKVAIVHGKQSNEEKKFNMDAFVAGRANILIATSVIEVGVDVPNASVMVIESAERFGLSQLHQLRGRVGRGSEKSYCILMTGNKVSKESRRRIEMMCATENGFELAEEDMKMRGPGDLEGTQQSGLPISLNIASLARDGEILNDARRYATTVLDRDPSLASPENAVLKEELRKEKYRIRDYSKIS